MGDYLHTACLRVFAKEDEDFDKIRKRFLEFFPFDLDEEKIGLKEQTAIGFKEKKIKILEAILSRKRHLKKFLEHMLNRLTKEHKELLIRQKESRLDEDLEFFIRFDKDKMIESGEYFITDSGNCFHLKLSIAAFPAKREKALAIIDKIFK
jgi:RNA binding exosome subunit